MLRRDEKVQEKKNTVLIVSWKVGDRWGGERKQTGSFMDVR
jgi:hypothetical protein